MKVVVTGAAGQVGARLVRQLLAGGHAVTGTVLPDTATFPSSTIVCSSSTGRNAALSSAYLRPGRNLESVKGSG